MARTCEILPYFRFYKKQKTKNAFVCAILQIKRIKKNQLEKIKRVGGNKAENQVDSSNALVFIYDFLFFFLGFGMIRFDSGFDLGLGLD